MSDTKKHDLDFDGWDDTGGLRGRAASTAMASATMVNRTHRVVRERARMMQARKSHARSLWIPLAISAGLLAVIFFAVWSVLDQYEVTPIGLPDASQQMLVLMMWCLPLSVAILAIVWFRRASAKADNGSAR
jgi:protein-S-isoprenylcysteine O-methyltransferase Ste14